MKRLAILFCMLMLLTLPLAACEEDVVYAPGGTTDVTERVIQPVDYVAMDELEAKIRRVADAALTEKYGITNFTDYTIEIDYHYGDDGDYFVDYDLYIFGYKTNESYNVRLSQGCFVKDVYGFSEGEYTRYLDHIIENAVKRAEAKLSAKVKEYGEEPHFYLSIDKEGYLCLYDEVIVDLEPPVDEYGYIMEGCGYDHEHVFLTERICPKP